MNIEIMDNTSPVNIKVVGVGGGGCNTINRMMIDKVSGIEFIAINTDLQALKRSKADQIIQIGKHLTKGQGAGADPEVGRQSAEEEYETIKKNLDGADMIFITSGMGGGTGTGAAPVVAKIAKEIGALTVAVVSKPFTYEMRMEYAQQGIANLKEHTDTLITIPNDYLANYTAEKLTIKNAFYLADSVLTQGIKGISDIVLNCGDINVDFADVRAVMNRRGGAIMSVVTVKETQNIEEIIDKITQNSLIENGGVIEKSSGLLVNIEHGEETTLDFINRLNEAIAQKLTTQNPKVIFGFMENNSLEGEVRVTLIATGIEEKTSHDVDIERFIEKENSIEDIEANSEEFFSMDDKVSDLDISSDSFASSNIDTEQIFNEIDEGDTHVSSSHYDEFSHSEGERVEEEEALHVLAVDQIAGYSQAQQSNNNATTKNDSVNSSFGKDKWQDIETPAYLRKRMQNNRSGNNNFLN